MKIIIVSSVVVFYIFCTIVGIIATKFFYGYFNGHWAYTFIAVVGWIRFILGACKDISFFLKPDSY